MTTFEDDAFHPKVFATVASTKILCFKFSSSICKLICKNSITFPKYVKA